VSVVQGREAGQLETVLRAARERGRKALVPYVMAGASSDWPIVVRAVAAAGADVIELGLPFSDPMIDGPVIQEADRRALQAGMTMQHALDVVADIDVGIPIVAMTYYNLILRAGHRRAARSMVAAGVTGAILPDLSLEELGPWAEEADAAGVATVLLVAPSSPPDRVRALCARSRGFVYAVAHMGVTGERSSLGGEAAEVVGRIRDCADIPAYVGIGISTPEQAAEACLVADGAVVGSALMRRVLDGGGPEAAAELVDGMRRALDAGA
jgi:tryptophan synthase alpha chain